MADHEIGGAAEAEAAIAPPQPCSSAQPVAAGRIRSRDGHVLLLSLNLSGHRLKQAPLQIASARARRCAGLLARQSVSARDVGRVRFARAQPEDPVVAALARSWDAGSSPN